MKWFKNWLKRREWKQRGVTIWHFCNIYPTAKIGQNVSIGSYTEIGPGVIIGDNVRIGAMCFIPEGVVIRENAWIGPRVTFTNDRYPPSIREKWEQTFVNQGAVIGAGSTIVPGVVIGAGAMIGAGSTVSRDINSNEVVAGAKATRLRIIQRRTQYE